MPHSSSGYGEIQVDRFYLMEQEDITESQDGKLALAGQESAPPTTVSMVTWLHGQIAGMEEGKYVPVTFRDKAERNGYYTVDSTQSQLTDYQSEVALADWTINLIRVGSDTEVDIQSRLTGASRLNDFSVTATRWHAPAINHYGYFTGSTIPSSITRTTEDGTMTVYTGVPTGTQPKWGCAVTDYTKGRVRLLSTGYVSTENEVEGINRSIPATGWTLSNGLITVTPQGTAGRLTIGTYVGSSYSTIDWNILVNGSNVAAWNSLSILRNDFEQVVIRLTASRSGGGRDTLDLSLHRGAQFVEGYLQTSASTTLGIAGANAATSASGANGTVAATAGAAPRRICGSSKSFSTVNTTNCGFTKTSVVALDFWIGGKITSSGAGTSGNDLDADLAKQYIGTMPEDTYIVRR